MKVIVFLLTLICLVAVSLGVEDSTKPVIYDKTKDLEQRMKTRYTKAGRPANQALYAKGFHRVVDTCTLSSGVDTITLNTSTADGKHDVSFTDNTTYHGRAWSMDIANRAKVYSILPLSGTKFIVVSSDAGDASTVYFSVEGE